MRISDWSSDVCSSDLLIDVKLAERRNLVMRNAADGVDWATTRTLVCAYQMIMPGAMAPSHRHPSNAMRNNLEGEGAFSVVDGVKMTMHSRDVVLTSEHGRA